MRQVVVGMMVAAALSGWTTAQAAEPSTNVLAYAAFGMRRVSVGSKARVTGDLGCLFDELSIGQGTRVTGSGAAPTIVLRKGGSASGGYFCTTLEGGADTCMPLPNPLIAGPAIVLAAPGNLDVSAPPRSKPPQPLSPGAYARLSVGAAAQVTLAGGSYQFESIDVRSRAKVQCLAACDLIVRTKVTVGQAARIGAADGVAPSAVIFHVAAQGERIAFDAKSRSTVAGSVYAPSADVKLGSATKLTGALVGNTVAIGPRARVQGPSGS